MTEPAIETVKLGKVYAGEVRALDEVSFRTGYGEAFAYLGRNGSGKTTTTIRILTTLTAATTGTARVAGHDVARDPAAVRRAIGVTMQHAALDETMTGRELLGFLAALWEPPRGAAAARIGEVVDRLGLGGVLDRRIAVLHGGRLAAEDTPDGLRRGRGGLRLRVRVDRRPDHQGWITRPVVSAGQAHQVLDGLVASGAAIAEFHLDEPTLEDAYLALTATQSSTAPPAAMAAVPT